MTQHNTLNVKLSNSQLNKNLKLSLNVAGDSNDESNFPHTLLLTNKAYSSF